MAWLGLLVAAILLFYVPIASTCLKVIRRSFSASYRHYDRSVCLTFDDGPDLVSTPTILETLRDQSVRATFFVLGRCAEEHPEMINAIARDGHEIGEHGYSHLHPWKSMPWTYVRDLIAGHRTLERLLGSDKKRRYRPTFGKANAFTFVFVLLFRKIFTFWNVDPHDYRAQHESDIVTSVLDQIRRVRGAAIVLLHDGRIANWKGGAARTAAAVETICKELRGEGYQFRTMSELTVGTGERPSEVSLW